MTASPFGPPRRAAVVGASGYVGAEVCRWLLGHPALALTTVVSSSHAGRPLADVVPALLGCTDLVLEPLDEGGLASHDVVFLATPHGAAAPLAASLVEAPLLVDCSADHRAAEGWVYGPPELVGDALTGASRIACPGCFATALELALGPLVAAGAVAGPVTVAAATGSTGSGATPSATTHHPLRATNLKAYKPLAHQHHEEVVRLLGRLGDAPDLHFVPWSAPIDRGIFATAFVPLPDGLQARPILADAYAGAPLVRLREGSPEVRHVRGTAFADLSVHQPGAVAAVLVAIDNLGKGAAAQAVQATNVALGLPAAAGLRVPGAFP